MAHDVQYIRMALRLAAKAKGRTRPNPMVGAVVVRSGRVVGRGFHRRAGRPHAEVLALRQAGRSAKGATLYVSLEPCPHTGRTPPCTEAIAAAGIRRVVAAMIDPNPRNRGRGLRWLRRRGIRTAVGILEEEARRLNEVFVTRMTARRPFVTVKVAQSLDGKIATRAGESRWISGPAARRWVQDLRSQADAVLVGVETVLKDDPLLTVRGSTGSPRTGPFQRSQPLRIILDSRLRTPPSARLFSSKGPVLIAAGAGGGAATRPGAPGDREKKLEKAGAEVLRLPGQGRDRRVSLPALLRELARREISHLLIEGGGEVIASAFRARAVDRIACVVAPKIVGGRDAPTSVEGTGIASLGQAIPLNNLTARFLGADLLVTGDVHWDR